MRFISIDVGSTYTKSMLFQRQAEGSFIFAQSMDMLTTMHDLESSVNKMLEAYDYDPAFDSLGISSSAKGGLRIAAVGIVPDITAKMALETAMGAGARVEHCYSYRLTDEDLSEIVDSQPDIVLLSGGTDGGNSDILNHNIHALSKLDLFVLFAGNRECKAVFEREFSEKLRSSRAAVTENILPHMNTPNSEPCREKIREIFLSEISLQKGFSRENILPTPMVVYDFCTSLGRNDLVILDLGGATCDVYSLCPAVHDPSVMFRGIEEPDTKRTVEGDLGLRVSSRNALEAQGLLREAKEAVLRIIQKNDQAFLPGWNPTNSNEARAESLFAAALTGLALDRHAGTLTEVFSSQGRSWVQRGKDLRGCRELFFTGGYFRNVHEQFCHDFSLNISGNLVPENYSFSFDSEYSLIHVANLSRMFPKEAIQLAEEQVFQNKFHKKGGIHA
jgi:uncharacterized protein (TIGR01319 family)